MHDASVVIAAETPKVLDTYALVYAFLLLFLVPGALLVGQLPFRIYTFAYVSLVTVPFLLALLATFVTDSCDAARTVAIRIGVLTPLIVLTGVTVLFGSSLLLVPINRFLGPEYRALTTPLAALLLLVVASPLVVAVFRRVGGGFSVRVLTQLAALVLALALVGAVAYLSVWEVGYLGDVARKDIVIYIIGGLVWYGPAFGLAAGVWRRLGLV